MRPLPKDLVALLAADPQLQARVRAMAAETRPEVLANPADVAAVLGPMIGWSPDCERFAAIAVDRRRRVIDVEVLTVGSDGFCIVDPKQVFRWALTRQRSVAAIIVGHNHPSGDPTPSHQDRDVTRRLIAAGAVIGIDVLDHVIVARERHCSLRAEGDISFRDSAPVLYVTESP